MSAGGIVLAGGRSSRMGADKASLDWHGTPLVAHVSAAVRAAVGGPVIVVVAPGQALPDLPAGVETAADDVEGLGPLAGLAAGLEALGGRVPAAYACATDAPFVSSALIGRLLRALRDGDDAVAVVADGIPQPLAAVYRPALAQPARTRLAAGRRSLRGLLAAVRTREIDAASLGDEERRALASLDTPEAYRRALRASEGRSS